jgi:hypothetical protein
VREAISRKVEGEEGCGEKKQQRLLKKVPEVAQDGSLASIFCRAALRCATWSHTALNQIELRSFENWPNLMRRSATSNPLRDICREVHLQLLAVRYKKYV